MESKCAEIPKHFESQMLLSDKTSQPCRRDGVSSRGGDEGAVAALQWPSCPGSLGTHTCSPGALLQTEPGLSSCSHRLFASSAQNDLQHRWGRMGKRMPLIPTFPEFSCCPHSVPRLLLWKLSCISSSTETYRLVRGEKLEVLSTV